MGVDTGNILDSTFWEQRWIEAAARRKEKKRLKNVSEAGAWDRRARHFDRKVSGEEGSARSEAVLKFLKDEAALFPGMSVVDIGCGPGSITLLLADRAGYVCALDPSEEMLNILARRAEDKNYKHIEMVRERWQDVDLEEKGWQDAFDLAFASMSPGVGEPETLRKLIRASRRFCYMSTFAGSRDRPREELWEIVTGSPFERGEMDIIYPLNILYTWGYRPSLRFFRHYRVDYFPKDEAVENLLQYLHVAVEVGDEVVEKVRRYVGDRLQGSLFRHEREVYHGMLLWDKNMLITNK